MRTLRGVIAAALLLGPVSGAGPARASDDGWVLQSSGTAATRDVHLGGVRTLLTDALATGAGCRPRVAETAAYNLRWQSWANRETGEIAYVWFGPGSAAVSTDCASKVDVVVQVSDYAPAGQPPVVRGIPATRSESSPAGGRYSAFLEASDWVIYYDLDRAYARGESLVEIKVSGSYYDPGARRTVPLPCTVTYTRITPMPTGPIVGETTQPQRCA